ncbi:hypothetical protein GE061_012089 [Apolygus lucorum]|uniref:Uncharacterized protein n=1 Tax=Apolygus lucorum TaxID=248454 RepID=A0A8S9XTZ7_APOLU|nr:hypothetical protein GE061_012089 [Apolygus lucorum]
MYKTVRQGEASLQYRILPQEDTGGRIARAKRLRRSRIACILIASLVVGCLTVTAAVIIPILLTTNIVALPAKFQTFALSTKHGKYNLQGAQYIAILPVKEAHFKEIKVFQAEHRNQTEKTRALFFKEDWPSLPAWKAIGVGRLAIVGGILALILLILVIILKRRSRNTTDQELGWDLQGAGLLSEAEDD